MDDNRGNHIDFRSRGLRSRSTLSLCVQDLVDTIQTSFCPITFKLHRSVMDDRRRNRIDFGSLRERSRPTLALYV